MKAITVSLFLLVFRLFYTIEAFVPANVTIFTGFLNCTQDLVHISLLYNVTETGSLMITPEGDSHNSRDYDLEGLHACIQIFGPIFDVYVDFGQATYHPDAVMLPFVPSAAPDIVNAGLVQRQHQMLDREMPDIAALGEGFRNMAQNAGFDAFGEMDGK